MEGNRISAIQDAIKAIETLCIGVNDNIDDDYTEMVYTLHGVMSAAAFIAAKCSDKLKEIKKRKGEK